MDAVQRKRQVDEIVRCGKDPVYFINTYVKIQHPVKGLVPFKTYPFQNDCIKAYQSQRFNIVLKSRQLGLSTISAAYATWQAIFHKDKNILVIATKLETAINFIKKVKTMIQSIPAWLMLPKYEDNKRSIRFNNGSVITAIPTSDDAGRSEALSLLIVDECAFIKNFEDIWAGLSPTISTGGRAILISTPNGVGGQYYKLWTEAEAGLNQFNPIRLMWWVHPEHNQEWFDKETKNLPKRKISQEFLCVAGGTRIITKDGYRPVEELRAGDEVLTHKGRFRKILETHGRIVQDDEKLFGVTSPGNRKNQVLITGDHPALSYRFWGRGNVSTFNSIPFDAQQSWIPIKEIAAERSTYDKISTCLFPILDRENIIGGLDAIDLTDVHEYCERDDKTCRYAKQWGSNKRFVPVDYNLGKMVGLYLAEGCNARGGLDLGFHRDEYDTHRAWVEDYLTSFNCRTISFKQGIAKSCRIWTFNRFFGSLMRKFVLGKHAHDKYLDWDLVMRTNMDFILGLLEGHYLGDGNHNHTNKFSIFSTSSRLIYQLRSLYSLFGLYPRIGRNDINAKNPRRHDMWYLEFYANNLSYNELMKSGQVRLVGSRTMKFGDHFIGSLSTTDMSSLISQDGGVTVYDLKVEEDASFVAESIVLHNCDFISSGDTFLQAENLEYIKANVENPIEKAGADRNLWIWENPTPGGKYVISADVSRGDGADYSAFHVINATTFEVAAEYIGKIPPDRFAEFILETARRYNDAVVCPENNTFGYMVCMRIKEAGYQRLYYPSNKTGDLFSYTPLDVDEIPGFSTQVKSRTQILANLEQLIRNRKVLTKSQRLYDELQAFVWNGQKAQAMKDSHDDLVMALAIGMWIIGDPSGGASSEQALAQAMLKATMIEPTRQDHKVLQRLNEVGPPGIAKPVVHPGTVHRPQAITNPNFDFSWLYR